MLFWVMQVVFWDMHMCVNVISLFTPHCPEVSGHKISAVRGTMLMRLPGFILLTLQYEVVNVMARAFEHSQEKNSGARSQVLDLPVTDYLLWASHWVTKSSASSCGGSISKQSNRKGEKQSFNDCCWGRKSMWKDTNLKEQKYAWLIPSAGNTGLVKTWGMKWTYSRVDFSSIMVRYSDGLMKCLAILKLKKDWYL